MGKTRLEELFYELYASSKQHDSWQRYAMIVELRHLMKQPKGSGYDHFERALDDEELAEIEAETKSSGSEDRAVENEANATMISAIDEKESMPKFQVPVSDLEHGLRIHNASSIVCEDSQYVVGCDELCDHQKSMLQVSYVKEVEELPQKSTSGNGEHVAHQLFDQKPVRVTHKEKHVKHLKAWKFKFKPTSKRTKLMDDMFSFVEETALLKKDPKETIWDCVKKEFKETMAACGKKRVDRFKLIEEIGSSATNNVQVTEWIHEEESEKERKWKDVKLSGSLQSYYDDQVKSTELVVRDQTQEIRSDDVYSPWVSVKRDGAVETQTCISRQANRVWKPGTLEQVMVSDDVVSLEKHVKLSDCVALPLITPSSPVLMFSHANRSVWEPGEFQCVQVQENRVQHEKESRLEVVTYKKEPMEVDTSEVEHKTESFPFLNFAAGQHLLWMQNKYEPTLIVLELKGKKKLCYKTWMFKYKADEEDQGILRSRTGWVQEVSAVICFLRRRHLHLHRDCEEPELVGRKRIWEKETHDVDIPDTYYVLQEEFEQVENHTPCSVVKLERPQDHDALLLPLPGDERFQIKHKWRFKLLLSILELELYLDSLVLITSYATSLIS